MKIFQLLHEWEMSSVWERVEYYFTLSYSVLSSSEDEDFEARRKYNKIYTCLKIKNFNFLFFFLSSFSFLIIFL